MSTWHDGLLGYVGGDETRRDEAEHHLARQAREAGIELNFHVRTHWQPVDSQRLLLWAGRYGKQEAFMTCLNKRHFEQTTSASETPTLLEAAAEAGLDVDAAKAFLATDELAAEVWRSYGQTQREKGIHSIPLFVFNCPQLNLIGGPFRVGSGTPFVLNGSMDAPTFLRVFEDAHSRLLAAQRTQPLLGRRVSLHSLSRLELNGRCGVATGVNEASGRYAVALEGERDRPPMAIKPTNLERADPIRRELPSQPVVERVAAEVQTDMDEEHAPLSAPAHADTCPHGSCAPGGVCMVDDAAAAAAGGDDDDDDLLGMF